MTKGIAWVVVAVVVGLVIWWSVPRYFNEQEDPRSAQSLTRLAAEINRSAPAMIDKETELLPVVGAEGMLIYNYRLVNYSVTQLDPDKFAAGVKQHLTQAACTRPETRDDLLKKGVTMRYTYLDKDKQFIATVDVRPADCGF